MSEISFKSKYQQLYKIQQISRKLDIPKSTLRFWEKELEGFILPVRTSGGQRRYTMEHLSIIIEISRMRKQGMSISEIKQKLSYGCEEKKNHFVTSPIDLLADQVSELVKKEIKRFFETEFSNS
jgi:DNA-binding transcriptional MerR regulator